MGTESYLFLQCARRGSRDVDSRDISVAVIDYGDDRAFAAAQEVVIQLICTNSITKLVEKDADTFGGVGD